MSKFFGKTFVCMAIAITAMLTVTFPVMSDDSQCGLGKLGKWQVGDTWQVEYTSDETLRLEFKVSEFTIPGWRVSVTNTETGTSGNAQYTYLFNGLDYKNTRWDPYIPKNPLTDDLPSSFTVIRGDTRTIYDVWVERLGTQTVSINSNRFCAAKYRMVTSNQQNRDDTEITVGFFVPELGETVRRTIWRDKTKISERIVVNVGESILARLSAD